MDRISSTLRSDVMRRVRSRDTAPEISVRKVLHAMGFRFRLHACELPGKPDIVLPKWRTVIFVNGCFWHQHGGCPKAARPSSNVSFWNRKLDRNIARDRTNISRLRATGWRPMTLWECRINDTPAFRRRIGSFIRKARPCPTEPR